MHDREGDATSSYGLPTNGDAWRSSQGEGAPRDPGKSSDGSSCGSKFDPASEPPIRRGPADKAADVAGADAVADGGSTASSNGGGGSTSKLSATEGGGKKSDKRSTSPSSPSPRSLEYLFFTGRRGGTAGVSRCTGGKAPGGGVSVGGGVGGGGPACESWQPDLLKLAEDGFHLPDWSEAGIDRDSDADTAAFEKTTRLEEEPSAVEYRHPSAHPGIGGARDKASTSKRPERGAGGEERSPSWPQSVVLSTHLSKADIPGMSGEVAVTGAAVASKINSAGVAPPGLIGLGNGEFVSPVCRVLVVKVYTGRTYRLPAGSSSGADGGLYGGWSSSGSSSGSSSTGSSTGSSIGGVPRPGVLREAWATGFKAVCVSGESEGREGRDSGDVDGGGGSSSTTAPSRYQVSLCGGSCSRRQILEGEPKAFYKGRLEAARDPLQRVAPREQLSH